MEKSLNNIANEMNLIWKKDKLQKYSRESITSPTLAAGDGVELHCRLCGASDHLQLITNDRLDETLRLYFGVEVPPEGVICESCIKCMKITEGFSALVHASFDKTVSEGSSRHTRILAEFTPGVTNLPATNPQKEILSLLKTKLSLENPRRRENRRRITKTNSNTMFKKMIVPCTVCGQKYSMYMTNGAAKTFVCSRCQKGTSRDRNLNNILSSVNKVEMRCKMDLNRKNRLNTQNSILKKPRQIKQHHSATKLDRLTKHQCSQCPKKYAVAENLATHMRTVHEGSSSFTCTICGKKLKSQDNLDKHLKEHTGVSVYQCTECVRMFRSNRALHTHRAFHVKQNVKSII